MLKQRIITALVLLPIALGGFFLLEGAFFALFIGAVVSLGAWEWARLAGYVQQFGRVAYAATVAVLMVALYHLPQLAGAVLLLALVWWTLATVLVLTYPESVGYWGGRWRLGMGLLILLPAWQGLVLLKQWPLANGLIIAVMVLVWGADIGAYFSGKAFGKRKLAPRVSPGKSWEGVYGGLAASLAITLAVGLYRGWSSACCSWPCSARRWWCSSRSSATSPKACSSASPESRTAATCCPATVACWIVSTA